MHEETLWNGIVLRQQDGQFRLSSDSVCCAWFARFQKHARVADLGCGSGAIALMLLASDPSLAVTGIELQPQAAAAARGNAACNGVNFSFLEGDLRQIRSLLPAGSMDAVISNPPYFLPGSGREASGARSGFRSEMTCSLSQLADAASWLLRWGGSFVLVHRPERLADLIWELRSRHLEPKRIRFVRHRPDAPVSLVLLDARKGGKPALAYEPDLVFFDQNGRETEEFRQMYHRA